LSAEKSDAELVAACREGHAWAWTALLARHKRLVYSIPLRAGLSHEDAADVFQTVFARLVEHLQAIHEPQALAAWLITTCKRESWKVAGKRRREQGDVEIAGLFAARDEWLSGQHPDEDRWEVQARVRDSLEQVGGRCKELLWLLYWESDKPSYEDISSRLGLPVGSIGPTRIRCLQKMRRIYQTLAR